MNLVLKGGGLALGEEGRVLGDRVDQRLKPFAVGLGEVAQNMMQHQPLDTWMTNPDAHALEVRSDMSAKRAQAIVPSHSAAGLHPDFSRRQIELIMNDDYIF